jgi:hypothetical protein
MQDLSVLRFIFFDFGGANNSNNTTDEIFRANEILFMWNYIQLSSHCKLEEPNGLNIKHELQDYMRSAKAER